MIGPFFAFISHLGLVEEDDSFMYNNYVHVPLYRQQTMILEFPDNSLTNC